MTPLVESVCDLEFSIDHAHPRAADASEALAAAAISQRGDIDDALDLMREYSGAFQIRMSLNNEPVALVYWARTKPTYRWL